MLDCQFPDFIGSQAVILEGYERCASPKTISPVQRVVARLYEFRAWCSACRNWLENLRLSQDGPALTGGPNLDFAKHVFFFLLSWR